MPACTLNGVAFNKTVVDVISSPTTNLLAPLSIAPSAKKVGDKIEAPSGDVIIILREKSAGVLATQHSWELKWQKAPEATRVAIENIFLLGSTFTAVLPWGTFTVYCDLDGLSQEQTEYTDYNGIYYYDITLTLYRSGI